MSMPMPHSLTDNVPVLSPLGMQVLKINAHCHAPCVKCTENLLWSVSWLRVTLRSEACETTHSDIIMLVCATLMCVWACSLAHAQTYAVCIPCKVMLSLGTCLTEPLGAYAWLCVQIRGRGNLIWNMWWPLRMFKFFRCLFSGYKKFHLVMEYIFHVKLQQCVAHQRLLG
jgi:hypothetical protein